MHLTEIITNLKKENLTSEKFDTLIKEFEKMQNKQKKRKQEYFMSLITTLTQMLTKQADL